jgi:hypothetical protein
MGEEPLKSLETPCRSIADSSTLPAAPDEGEAPEAKPA